MPVGMSTWEAGFAALTVMMTHFGTAAGAQPVWRYTYELINTGEPQLGEYWSPSRLFADKFACVLSYNNTIQLWAHDAIIGTQQEGVLEMMFLVPMYRFLDFVCSCWRLALFILAIYLLVVSVNLIYWFIYDHIYIPLSDWWHGDQIMEDRLVELERENAELRSMVEENQRLLSELKDLKMQDGFKPEAVIATSPFSHTTVEDRRVITLYKDDTAVASAFKVRQLSRGHVLLQTGGHCDPYVLGVTHWSFVGSEERFSFSWTQYVHVGSLDNAFIVCPPGSFPGLRRLKFKAYELETAIKVYTPGAKNGVNAVGVINAVGLHSGQHSASTLPSSSGGPLLPIGSQNVYYGTHLGFLTKRIGDEEVNVNYFVPGYLSERIIDGLFSTQIVAQEALDVQAYAGRFEGWATTEYNKVWVVVYDKTVTRAPHAVQVKIVKSGVDLEFQPYRLEDAEWEIEETIMRKPALLPPTTSNWADQMDYWEDEKQRTQMVELLAKFKDGDWADKARKTLSSGRHYIFEEFGKFTLDPASWLVSKGMWLPDPESKSILKGTGQKKKLSKDERGKRARGSKQIAATQMLMGNEATLGLTPQPSGVEANPTSALKNLRGTTAAVKKFVSLREKLLAGQKTQKGLFSFLDTKVEASSVGGFGAWFKRIGHGFSVHDSRKVIEKIKDSSLVWVKPILENLGWPTFDADSIRMSVQAHCDLFLKRYVPTATSLVPFDLGVRVARKLSLLSKVASVGLTTDPMLRDKLKSRIKDFLVGPNFKKVAKKSTGVTPGVNKAEVMGISWNRKGEVQIDSLRFEQAFTKIWEFVQAILLGKDPDLLIKWFIKDEPTKVKKLDEGRLRLISGLDVYPAVLNLALGESLIQDDVLHWKRKPWCIGADLDHKDFGYHFHSKVGENYHDYDKSAWDWTVNALDVDFLDLYFTELYGADSLERVVFMSTFGRGANCVFVLPKEAYQQNFVGLLKSGWALTLHVNSVLQVAYQMGYNVLKADPSVRGQEADRIPAMLALGDDAVVHGDEKIDEAIYKKFWLDRGKSISTGEKSFCSRKLVWWNGFPILQNVNFDKSVFNFLHQRDPEVRSQAAQSMIHNFCFAKEEVVSRMLEVLSKEGIVDAEVERWLVRATEQRVTGKMVADLVPLDFLGE